MGDIDTAPQVPIDRHRRPNQPVNGPPAKEQIKQYVRQTLQDGLPLAVDSIDTGRAKKTDSDHGKHKLVDNEPCTCLDVMDGFTGLRRIRPRIRSGIGVKLVEALSVFRLGK